MFEDFPFDPDEPTFEDSESGAKLALQYQLEPKLNFNKATVIIDEWVAGVWAIKGVQIGDYVTDYIVYLKGYPDPFGNIRKHNDCEEVELK